MAANKLPIYDEEQPARVSPPTASASNVIPKAKAAQSAVEQQVSEVVKVASDTFAGPLSQLRKVKQSLIDFRTACSSSEDDIIPGLPCMWFTVHLSNHLARSTGRMMPRVMYPAVAFAATAYLFYPTMSGQAARFVSTQARLQSKALWHQIQEARAAEPQPAASEPASTTSAAAASQTQTETKLQAA